MFVFLNSANLVQHALLTLALPSAYALNLKALIKVSKVSLSSQLSYEILRSLFERKFDNTNFISPKKASQKHSFFRVKPMYSFYLPKHYNLGYLVDCIRVL